MLSGKSLVELRGIAQSLGIADIFQKTKNELVQAIEMHQQSLAPLPKIDIPQNPYDARLMTQAPGAEASPEDIEKALEPYTERGLQLTFTATHWLMRLDKRSDQGNLRMPLRHVLQCARRLMA